MEYYGPVNPHYMGRISPSRRELLQRDARKVLKYTILGGVIAFSGGAFGSYHLDKGQERVQDRQQEEQRNYSQHNKKALAGLLGLVGGMSIQFGSLAWVFGRRRSREVRESH